MIRITNKTQLNAALDQLKVLRASQRQIMQLMGEIRVQIANYDLVESLDKKGE